MGLVATPRPGRLIPQERDPVSILYEKGWAPLPVWPGAENSPSSGFDPGPSSPYRVAIPPQLFRPLSSSSSSSSNSSRSNNNNNNNNNGLGYWKISILATYSEVLSLSPGELTFLWCSSVRWHKCQNGTLNYVTEFVSTSSQIQY